MNRRSSLESKKAIAYRRNTYKREWSGFENALRQLGLFARFRPLSAEESLDTENRIREEITVSAPTRTAESLRERSVTDLESSIDHFLSVVGEGPLILWLLNSNGLLFEATGMVARDVTALIQYDGDTVVVCRPSFVSWLVLDENDDELDGRFFEMTVELGEVQPSSDE